MYDEDEAEELEKRIRKYEFTLDDYAKQIKKMRKIGITI